MRLAALAYPAIDPVAVRIGPLAVHWYGLAYVAAFVIAALVVRWLARRWELGLTDDDLLTVMLYAITGVIVGGRLGYVLFYGGSGYWTDPLRVFAVWDGGMSFHGGLAGIFIGGWFAARSLGMSWLTLADMGSVGAPAGFGLGRLANFVNGELWGKVTDSPWGMVFPGAGPLPRHPSQLYEAALEGLVLSAIMVALALRLPPRPRGELIGWMLVGYGAFRTGVEFFREPDAQLGYLAGGWLTMGMVLSVPLVVAGASLVVWARRRSLPHEGVRR